MSRNIVDDLEADDEKAERMEQLFSDVLRLNRPDDHAGRIIALADAPEIRDIELVD